MPTTDPELHRRLLLTHPGPRPRGHLTARAVGQLGDRFRGLDQRVLAYKEERLSDARAHDIVIRAVDCAAITPAQIPDVLLQWRKPVHVEFAGRNAWSLFNAFTEVQKPVINSCEGRVQARQGLPSGEGCLLF